MSTLDDRRRQTTLIHSPEPNVYVVRSNPALLTCKASNAQRITFKCNGESTDQSRLDTRRGYSNALNARYVETRLTVSRAEVEEYFGKDGFRCVCLVFDKFDDQNPLLTSHDVSVKIAHLRKYFEREPVSDRRPLGSTVHIPCLPPDGDPKPDVFWLKNQKEIESKQDTNVIIAHDGSLIISVAKLTDSGNYTCGARNIVAQRLSQSVSVSIYIEKSWSPWSAWSGPCSLECSPSGHPIGQQSRYRHCTSPTSEYDSSSEERDCQGPAIELRPCSTVCQGSWNTWSTWTNCNIDCSQSRTRSCDRINSPNPCPSSETVRRNCTVTECLPAVKSNMDSSDSFRLSMTAGLGATVFVFLLTVLVLLYLQYHRRRHCKRSHCSNDMSSYKTRSELLYDVPYIQKAPAVEDTLKWRVDDEDQQLYETVDYYQEDCEDETNNNALFDYDILDTRSKAEAAKTVGFHGGQLFLSNCSVGITVPEGAIHRKDTVDISVSLSLDISPLPSHCLLSPVVDFGPSTYPFRKPVLVTIPHCLNLSDPFHSSWRLCIYVTDKDDKTWTLACTLGEETLNTEVYCQVRKDCLHILCERLSKMVLVGYPIDKQACKRMRVLSFLSTTSLNVYLLPDLPTNVKCAYDAESDSQTHLVSDPHLILVLQHDSNNLLLSLTDAYQSNTTSYQISYQDMWSLSTSAALCRFSYQDLARCRLIFYQKGFNAPQHDILLDGFRPLITLPDESLPIGYQILSQKMVDKLSALLNSPIEAGNDWRMLAKLLSLDRYLPYFASRQSPTELLLMIWNAQVDSQEGVKQLWSVFFTMQRLDACRVLNTLIE